MGFYADGHISREDEARIPPFDSHDEARQWFKAKYGEMFMLMDSEIIGGQKCYFHNLVLDYDTWLNGQEELKRTGSIVGMKYLGSYQAIQIFADGHIHIVH